MNKTTGHIIRAITLGHVDDGKSTLIGRLLYDSKALFEDQLTSIKKASFSKGNKLDLSMITDGLKDEREQGITIDVAYRYFSTPENRFILIDSPGHEEYTRNMVTGASNANAAMILVDARNGLQTQTKRHLFIANLLGIENFVVCINKMDLVDYKEDEFKKIVAEFEPYQQAWDLPTLHFIPISALEGDNIVEVSTNMPWFKGNSLIKTLAINFELNPQTGSSFRLPIQYVYPDSTEKIVAGKIASGNLCEGDVVSVMRTGETAKVDSILNPTLPLAICGTNQSVTIYLDSPISIIRGDVFVHPNEPTKEGNQIEAMICWLDTSNWEPTQSYLFQHLHHRTKIIIKEILYLHDINQPSMHHTSKQIGMNDIAKIKIELQDRIFFDTYKENHITGSFILIDPITNHTVAAGLIQ